MKEKAQTHTRWRILIQYANQEPIEVDRGHNILTNAGINALLACLVNPATTCYFGYLAVSDSSATPSATNTTLPGEVQRVAITSATAQTGSNEITLSAELGYGDANGYSLTKFGFLSAASGGTLWNETNNTAITKTSAFKILYEYVFGIE